MKETGFNNLLRSKKVVTVLGTKLGFSGFIVVGILYNQDGFDVDPITNAVLSTESTIEENNRDFPRSKGSYTVKTLTYGSRKDLHRPAYGAKVSIKTNAINGLAFIDNWEGFRGWWREKYWGFDAKSLPINTHV